MVIPYRAGTFDMQGVNAVLHKSLTGVCCFFPGVESQHNLSVLQVTK